MLVLAAESQQRWGPQLTEVDLALISGLECRAYFRLGNAESSRARCQDAATIAARSGNLAVHMIVQRLVAYVSAEAGEPTHAVPMLRDALRQARQLGDRYNEVVALNSLGIASQQAGVMAEAADYVAAALALADEIGDVGMQAVTRANLGFLYRQVKDAESALVRLQDALLQARAASNVSLAVTIEVAIAESLLMLGRTDEAAQRISLLLDERSSEFDPRFKGEMLRVAGRVAQSRGRYAEAETQLRAAIGNQSTSQYRRLRAANDLVSMLIEQQRYNAALVEADRVIAASASLRMLRVDALDQKSRVLSVLGRYREALELRVEADAERQTLTREQGANQLAFLRASLDADIKDREIRDLQQRERDAEASARSARDTRNWTLLAMGLTASLVFLSWRLWLRRHDTRSREQLQQEVARRSEQLEAELHERRRLEQELEQRRRLESIGRLTGGVAHDYNNLMTIVQQSCDLLLRRPALIADPGAVELIDECTRAAQVAGGISRQLVAFARQTPLKPARVFLPDYFGSARALLERAAGSDRELDFDIEANLSVMVDTGPLSAALINLVSNARDATEPGATISVRARRHTVDMLSPPRARRAPGVYGAISVSDDGEGMDAATVARCVEPFFTTKAGGAGVGLGLSMVHGLTTQSGGDLLIESEVGRGTRVTLLLPIA
jgi:signal transduction histidine kinase